MGIHWREGTFSVCGPTADRSPSDLSSGRRLLRGHPHRGSVTEEWVLALMPAPFVCEAHAVPMVTRIVRARQLRGRVAFPTHLTLGASLS